MLRREKVPVSGSFDTFFGPAYVFSEHAKLKLLTEKGNVAPLQTEGRVTWIPIRHNNDFAINLRGLHRVIAELGLSVTLEIDRAKDEKSSAPPVGSTNLYGEATASQAYTADPKKKKSSHSAADRHYILHLDYDSARASATNDKEKMAQLLDKQLKEALLEVFWKEYQKSLRIELKNMKASLAVMAVGFFVLLYGMDVHKMLQPGTTEFVNMMALLSLLHVMTQFIATVFNEISDSFDDDLQMWQRDGGKGDINRMMHDNLQDTSNVQKIKKFERFLYAQKHDAHYDFWGKVLSIDVTTVNLMEEHWKKGLLSFLAEFLPTILILSEFVAKTVPIIPVLQRGTIKTAQSMILRFNEEPLITVFEGE